MIWSALSHDRSLSVEDVLRQYGRYHWGAKTEELWLQILSGLEANWNSDLLTNANVYNVLQATQQVEASVTPAQLSKDWRLGMHLFRAYQDAYTRDRFLAEQQQEQEALLALAQAPHFGADAAIAAAQHVLARNVSSGPNFATLRKRVFELAAVLNVSASQPGKKEMGDTMIQHQNPFLGLHCLDVPLSNSVWLQKSIATIATGGNDTAKLEAIAELVGWEDPGPGKLPR